MDKETKDQIKESLAEVFHEAWVHWAKAVKAEVSAERSARWEQSFVPYDQLEETTKDLDRKWADEALEAIEPVLENLVKKSGAVKEMVTKVQVDSNRYPGLASIFASVSEVIEAKVKKGKRAKASKAKVKRLTKKEKETLAKKARAKAEMEYPTMKKAKLKKR
jgi:hypothetical protein